MSKREREITLLYGMSIIRDDVLNHTLPKVTAKDRALMAAHFMAKWAVVLCLFALPAVTIASLFQ
ncbi:hypothetical protein [Pseudescherichia sp.]|uniref:hypothetical protein n=1 Tax=Pseudescherichia sp. TaxID=2055881 RepID=UPI0028A1245E|nr:hypothetical protein [Pseudescherichia sp.]